MHSSKERNQDVMKKQTLGMIIATFRKEHGMTQLEPHSAMGIFEMD